MLESWIDHRGARPVAVNLGVGGDELCASTPSGDLEPYSSEYEGYMGNWGNTLDRWYHRGAVVVWPRSRAFVVQAEAVPMRALDEIGARARHGDVAGARQAAGSLAPVWDRVVGRSDGKALLTKSLRVALRVDEPTLAAMLLRPFRLDMIATAHAKPLGALVGAYGEQWAADLVVAWSARLATALSLHRSRRRRVDRLAAPTLQ